ncbi:hypothetical protein BMA10399_A0174 [Burkholderia mallei ATCC 10399]|nr:hypothetical protein BMA10399_A0174 [Burkholderia mallei ATCC 10399]
MKLSDLSPLTRPGSRKYSPVQNPVIVDSPLQAAARAANAGFPAFALRGTSAPVSSHLESCRKIATTNSHAGASR